MKKLVNELEKGDVLKRKSNGREYVIDYYIRGGEEVVTNIKENFYFKDLGFVSKNIMTRFFESSYGQVLLYNKVEEV